MNEIQEALDKIDKAIEKANASTGLGYIYAMKTGTLKALISCLPQTEDNILAIKKFAEQCNG